MISLGSATLPFTLYIVLVMTLLSLGLIQLNEYSLKTADHSQIRSQLLDNSLSGIYYAMALPTSNRMDTLKVNLFENKKNNVTVYKKLWGIYTVVRSEAFFKHQTISRIGFIGRLRNSSKDSALYLSEQELELTLGGKTKITGTVHLPKRGIKSGYVAGIPYLGVKLIYGDQKLSKEELPQFQQINSALIKEQIERTKGSPDQLYEHEKPHRSLMHSFNQEPLRIYSKDTIYIDNIELTGNIHIHSDRIIYVRKSANLQDVLLTAQSIFFDDDVKAKLQAFASKSLVTGKRSKFLYPSALGIFPLDEGFSVDSSQVKLNKKTIVYGSVIFDSDEKKDHYSSNVLMEEKTKVYGDLYCKENLELRGSVYGSVYTNRFILKKSGRIYNNHLLDATIDGKSLPKEYIRALGKPNHIMQWLY